MAIVFCPFFRHDWICTTRATKAVKCCVGADVPGCSYNPGFLQNPHLHHTRQTVFKEVCSLDLPGCNSSGGHSHCGAVTVTQHSPGGQLWSPYEALLTIAAGEPLQK